MPNLWAALIFAGLGLREVIPQLQSHPVWDSVGELLRRGQSRELTQVISALRTLEESLQAGWSPPLEVWQRLSKLPLPWGRLCSHLIDELRACGAPLLPTLHRLRGSAEDELRTAREARARVSQAWAQAAIGLILVPLFGGTLYLLLPELRALGSRWWMACLGSLSWGLVGSLWMLELAAHAGRAGLPADKRTWPLLAQLMGERFLGMLRAGRPADVAWSEACRSFTEQAPELAQTWARSIWWPRPGPEPSGEQPSTRKGCEGYFDEAGQAIRRGIQASVLEGRPCMERVEGVLRSLREKVEAEVERQMGLLATRALKPLFLCTAPSLLALLGLGLWACL